MTSRSAGQTTTIMAGILAGLVIGISLAEFPLPGRAGNERLSLVSDNSGALERIVLHYCRDFHEESVEVFVDLLSSLHEDTEVSIVVKDLSEFRFLVDELSRRGVAGALDMSPVVTGFSITPWAKDRFGTMISRHGEPVIVTPSTRSPMSGPRGNDGRVPGVLAERLTRLSLRHLPFQFDGGDMLCDEEYAFISSAMLARNKPYDVDDRAGLIKLIASTIQRKPIVLGNSIADVPDHHIGMFITPLGNRVVAVADPDLGRRLISDLGVSLKDVSMATDDKQYQPFRNVGRILTDAGFRVVRVPMVLTTQYRVYMTYNNALQEQRADEKRIYMPVYGIPELDRRAAEVFEAEGWTVYPIRVGRVFKHTGSLRCLVGVLERKLEQTPRPGTS